jgi:hypothetical protein
MIFYRVSFGGCVQFVQSYKEALELIQYGTYREAVGYCTDFYITKCYVEGFEDEYPYLTELWEVCEIVADMYFDEVI